MNVLAQALALLLLWSLPAFGGALPPLPERSDVAQVHRFRDRGAITTQIHYQNGDYGYVLRRKTRQGGYRVEQTFLKSADGKTEQMKTRWRKDGPIEHVERRAAGKATVEDRFMIGRNGQRSRWRREVSIGGLDLYVDKSSRGSGRVGLVVMKRRDAAHMAELLDYVKRHGPVDTRFNGDPVRVERDDTAQTLEAKLDQADEPSSPVAQP